MKKIKYTILRTRVLVKIINYNKFIIPLLTFLIVASLFMIFSLLSFGVAYNNSQDAYSHYKISKGIKYTQIKTILNNNSDINFRIYLDEKNTVFFSKNNHLEVLKGQKIEDTDNNKIVLGTFSEGIFSNKKIGEKISIDEIEYEVKGLSVKNNRAEITKPKNTEELYIYYILIEYNDLKAKDMYELRSKYDREFSKIGFEILYGSEISVFSNQLYYFVTFMLILVSLFPFVLFMKYNLDKSKKSIDVFKILGIGQKQILSILLILLNIFLIFCFILTSSIFIPIQNFLYVNMQYNIFNFAYQLKYYDYLLIYLIIIGIFSPFLLVLYYKIFKYRSFIDEKS